MAPNWVIAIVLALLPAAAFADQCIEGDCVNGKGTIVYSTGHRYTGEFKNGRREGDGVLTLPGGRTLKGRFEGDAIVEGNYTSLDGKAFTGRWELRERNGQGRLQDPDGRVDEGAFKSGVRTGKGVMTWPDGRRYEGDFVNGQRTGKGTMTYPNGRVYTGDFVDGERTGQGVMVLPDGTRLQGRFKNGQYMGP